ncbi:bifunctional diaminohydroxyphosphoribosylaminopyrimidine deaminase/5-amino-6-(5-phosphoribosylamino)uracil reductase RibD [Segetibacter sp. 3557_3]|uniref:bifunctional diaminohydroxyphosphoribosylaminopyrimidine deaminase/5-amino-6-(5-phosphoribosylamino)uracil reductase RibD n=1 Tax=Segetibacter sp. 3557_3 TaxID=2547429 RepID=UPI0010591594|nr:bifunctional diaminohydroxyphosphoribosylaminopyrimidine deaminase/5-amino-6-(5-phosphoribosylamino)uracil reductase RibD [Segetibacter sp. 3557_3]TDH27741.1 bifunctional diaminohydroxyphosphoribosylaminopyrimidine deaminase/5-amino-6-(5-phosphoribosylamino)uracil reductase RibD [Segetibacter sp. 3557_3]
MDHHELYMFRCIELAKLGAGAVAPNPMVGAVLVHEGRIIGEGFHQGYGQPHAEVNCINSVRSEDKHLLPFSTIYVSLEPCAHFGKTPPCADLLIREQIPEVVVGCRDPFDAVNGKGIEKLRSAGRSVMVGILEQECTRLNKRFFTFHTKHRPYIVLKWAQSRNLNIASHDRSRVFITNEVSNRLVHCWRTEEAAIMVGTNTALADDPHLNTRKWPGIAPTRLILDLHLRLPDHLNIFDRKQPTIILNRTRHQQLGNLTYHKLDGEGTVVQQVLAACVAHNIQSLFIEGGASLLQSFIDEQSWDEARVLTNTALHIEEGLSAPRLRDFRAGDTKRFLSDELHTYYPNNYSY